MQTLSKAEFSRKQQNTTENEKKKKKKSEEKLCFEGFQTRVQSGAYNLDNLDYGLLGTAAFYRDVYSS